MAGISSKALNGAAENKRKYQQYEFNSDFDLNLYESFYRTHDPQIGRFLQIDPKPLDLESPYAAMGNNPIKNTDFLGDTTIYYSSSGAELLRTTEGSKAMGNVVTFVSDKNLRNFNSYVSTIGADGGNLSEDCSVNLLRGQGESYDVQGVFSFVDGNSKNVNTQTDIWQPTDGKGPLINEQSAAVEKKNGVWTPNSDKTDKSPGSPFAVSLQGSGVTLHTHENEGRKFSETSNGTTRYGSVPGGKESLGADGDIGRAQNKPGTGVLQMAATKKSIYFYNSSGVVQTVNRDAFNPKYFKKP
jgi:RHS repeat-associated protein